MSLKTALLRGVALGATAAVAVGACAHAESADAKARRHHHHRVLREERHEAARAERSQASEEINALRAEVEALKARLDAQAQSQAQVQAQVAQTQSQVQQVAESAEAAQAKIETIPEQVNVAIGELPKPKTDAFYVKGVKITPGGFIELAGIYRSRDETADVGSNYNSIPYSGPGTTASSSPGNAASVGHAHELRFSARQSRVSALIEGNVDPDTKLSAWFELDFLGAGQTANSNESNSYNPRIRNIYGTLDKTDLGFHLLAGQNWSLVTLNSKGITPRNEVTPLTVDAQYVPGFDWARQPQVRVTEQLTPELWIAASAENPQTTFYASGSGSTAGSLSPALRLTYNETGGSLFNNANTYSLNHIPDVVVKGAFEPVILGAPWHFEAYGLFRNYYYREASGVTVNAPVAPSTAYTITSSAGGNSNQNAYGGGVGFGVIAPVVPKVLDLQLSGLGGRGIGRYGTSQLPDATFRYDGKIEPIQERMFLAGAILHASPMLDVYSYYGQEAEHRTSTQLNGLGYGYGNPLYINSGCFGESLTSTCVGNTRSISQETVGFWDKLYNGPFGQFRFGLQYSHTFKKSFLGQGGAPSATEDMGFMSLRWYPFQ